MFFSNFVGYGTGFLIGKNVVLTAAHNIYNRDSELSAGKGRLVMGIHRE